MWLYGSMERRTSFFDNRDSCTRHVASKLVCGVQGTATPIPPTRPCATIAATRALNNGCRFNFVLRRECADFGHKLFHILYIGFFCYPRKVVLFDFFQVKAIVVFYYD